MAVTSPGGDYIWDLTKVYGIALLSLPGMLLLAWPLGWLLGLLPWTLLPDQWNDVGVSVFGIATVALVPGPVIAATTLLVRDHGWRRGLWAFPAAFAMLFITGMVQLLVLADARGMTM